MKYAVCLFQQRFDGLILAVSRKSDRTKFGLPGGKIDPGETAEQAVVREVREETGLTLANPKPVFYDVDSEGWFTTTYTGDVSGMIHTLETGEVSWVTPEVLLSGPFGQYNAKLFDRVGVQ